MLIGSYWMRRKKIVHQVTIKSFGNMYSKSGQSTSIFLIFFFFLLQLQKNSENIIETASLIQRDLIERASRICCCLRKSEGVYFLEIKSLWMFFQPLTEVFCFKRLHFSLHSSSFKLHCYRPVFEQRSLEIKDDMKTRKYLRELKI